jgi:DNA-binding response OmpR family regulator
MDAGVLIVEDAPELRGLVRALLERAGCTVHEAANGADGVQAVFDHDPDLVILDLGLPGRLDGWSVLARIREAGDVPVLMLTAEDAELARVRGLRAGADDYVTKPFSNAELVARVEALLRRSGRREKKGAAPAVYDDGRLRIDFAEHRVTQNGLTVQLTPLEFRLLAALARRPGELVTHEELLEQVWNDQSGGGRERVKLYVGYLRRKLGTRGVSPIETVRGMGYRYKAPAASPDAADAS